MSIFSKIADAFKGVGKFFSDLFSAPKMSLPQIIIPEVKNPLALPVIKPPAKPKVPRGGQSQDISQFSQNLTPSLQAILGLSVPKVSPGMLIPGVNNDNG